MARDDSGGQSRESDVPRGDPWAAFGYLVAGVGLYGVIGWGLDRWWGTSFMVAVGIVVGAAFGIYLSLARFRVAPERRQSDEHE